jgi:cell division protein ZapA (FtsZ GTPase activity inhibitor)
MATQTQPQTIELRLQGQKIVLKAIGSDAEDVREVVELVKVKIKNAEKRGKSAAGHQVALLALMDLAEDYLKAKRKTAEFKRAVTHKSEQLSMLLSPEALAK